MEILTKEEVKKFAPAVYATAPKNTMSNRYAFVPTHEVLDNFAKAGWYPTKVFQSKITKKSSAVPEERKHVVRLSNPDFQPVMKEVGSLVPEIVLINSHDGTSNIRMDLGIFRMVCTNGMIISDSKFAQIKRRHSGNPDEIFQVIADAGKEFPEVWDKVNEYKSIHLTNKQRIDFAVKTVELNWGENSVIEPQSLLISRRKDDEDDDLWTTYNVLQENVIKGGVSYIHPHKNRERHTRAIKNQNRDIAFNRQLWMMMEAFRTTKKFR